jgi:hypothetical protein
MQSNEEFNQQGASVLDSVVDPSFGEIAEIYREYGLDGGIERGTTPRGSHSTLRVNPEGGRSGYVRVECDEERRTIKIIRSFNHVAGGLAEQVGEYSPEALTREILDGHVDEFVSELLR